MGIALATGIASALVAAPADAATPAKVPSSLISVTQAATWNEARWGYEFRDAAAAGVKTLILNGAAVDSGGRATAYYPAAAEGVRQATSATGAPLDVVTPLLKGARAAGMKVWLGTYLPASSWYSPSDSTVAAMTSANAGLTESIIRDLDAQFSSYGDVIEGWYLGSEVSAAWPWSWKAGEALVAYYTRLSTAAKSATLAQRTMISPYYNVSALNNPTLWTNMWTRVLSAAPLDVIALQDGTGDCGDNVCGPWRSIDRMDAELTTKFEATAKAAANSGGRTQVWANLDLYDAFGWSKPVGDVAHVWSTVAPYVSGYTAWSYTRQYSPWTLGTNTYHLPFQAWNTTGSLPTAAPSTPAVTSTSRSGTSTTVTWSASTPAAGSYLAYYRVVGGNGVVLGNVTTSSRSWTGSEQCPGIVSVDTAGNASPAATTC